jgi:hypothetical protein
MSDNVVRFGGNTPSGMVNDKLVTMLEELVERAKRAEIVGLAYAATDGDDVIMNGWESGGHNLLLSSSVAVLNHAYQNRLHGE